MGDDLKVQEGWTSLTDSKALQLKGLASIVKQNFTEQVRRINVYIICNLWFKFYHTCLGARVTNIKPSVSFFLSIFCFTTLRDGHVAQLVEHQTGMLPKQVRFPGVARDFSPMVNFHCRLSYGVHTPQCAITCIYICLHVKDPIVYVRVQLIMETLKHQACTVGWVAQLCHSWLSLGKAT